MATAGPLIKYRNSIIELGPLSGKVDYSPGLSLPTNRNIFVRALSAQLTKQIPNIYSYAQFDNTKLSVTNNASAGTPTWHQIDLPHGVYTLLELTLAITDAVGVYSGKNWYTNDAQPGILIEGNTSTGKVYIILDNSKTTGQTGRLGIRFDVGGTLYETLGYNPDYPLQMIQTDTNDGSLPGYIFKSTAAAFPPKLDTQGTTCDVRTSLNPEMSYVNSTNTDIILSIPLTVSGDNADEYFYPYDGAISPFIQLRNSGAITGLDVKLLTNRGEEMIFLYGDFDLNLQLTTMGI